MHGLYGTTTLAIIISLTVFSINVTQKSGRTPFNLTENLHAVFFLGVT